MRVLIIGEFDCCGVALRWCRHLGEIGIEARLAVQDCYTDESHGAHYVWSRTSCDLSDLRAYAAAADVVITTPAIGQPWSYQFTEFHAHRELDDGVGPLDFGSLPAGQRRIALFHGSRLLQATAEQYADLYRGRGFEIAATTLDYVARMRALYLPPMVSLEDRVGGRVWSFEPAELRRDGDPLRIIHSPTAKDMCQTDEFIAIVKRLGMGEYGIVVHGAPHVPCMNHKRRAHLGFDHVRGSFSVNSVENAALGLVNLVAVRPEYREWMRANGLEPPDWPRVENMGHVNDWLLQLKSDAEATRRWQERGRRWYLGHFSPGVLAPRMARVLEGTCG